MYFTEKLKLRGKAEEDLYFAKQEKALIEALHEKRDNGELEHWHDECPPQKDLRSDND